MSTSTNRFLIKTGVFAFTLFQLLSVFSPQVLAQSPSQATPSSLIEQIEDAPPKVGLSVTLSPVFLNLSIYAGKLAKSTIKLTNNNTFAERYRLSPIQFKPDERGESIVPVQDGTQGETVNWVHISRPEIVVQPKTSETVEFEVRVPEDAFLGYYLGISVQRSEEQFDRTDTTKVVGQVIMPIMLDVLREGEEGALFEDGAENIYKRAVVTDFKTTSWWYEYLPAEFEVSFKNTGKVHLAPFGSILIQQGDIDVGSVEFNESANNTLPGVTRVYKASWNEGFIVREPVKKGNDFVLDKNGNKTYHTVINWDSLTKMRIGKYTARAIVVFNNGRNDVPLEALVSFWIIPWRLILLVILILTLIVFGIKSALSNFIR